MNIRVFVYDDNLARRQSIKTLVELTDGLEFCGEAEDCSQVLEEMQTLRPDVVLMDIHMPGVDGITGLKMLKRNFPNIKVLMQTVFDDSNLVFESLRNGASGYVLKKDSPSKIAEAIKDVFAGGGAMNPGIAQKVLDFFAPKQLENPLSDREVEVLRLLSDGLSYKMAAAQLGLSFHTVNSHIKKIYEKLHVQSLGEAIAFYYKNFN